MFLIFPDIALYCHITFDIIDRYFSALQGHQQQYRQQFQPTG